MLLLLVSLYEFGQFLRIMLWISVPMFIVVTLVTTWLHYRRRQLVVLQPNSNFAAIMDNDELNTGPINTGHSKEEAMIEGEPWPTVERTGARNTSASEVLTAPADSNAPAREDGFEPDDNENMYRGILWLKDKYEQYRALSDQKIEELREALRKAEKKYQDLLDTPQQNNPASITTAGKPFSAPEPADGSSGMDQRVEQELRRELAEKDRLINQLQDQLQVQWQKTEELVVKLQNSSELLLNISREMDRTLPLPAAPPPAAALQTPAQQPAALQQPAAKTPATAAQIPGQPASNE